MKELAKQGTISLQIIIKNIRVLFLAATLFLAGEMIVAEPNDNTNISIWLFAKFIGICSAYGAVKLGEKWDKERKLPDYIKQITTPSNRK